MDNTEKRIAQGCVFSPILFYIYTNDQPLHDGMRSFIYADDLCVTSQYYSLTEIERTIGDALDKLCDFQYCGCNSLRENPAEMQVTAFYLRNKEEKLSLKWYGTRQNLRIPPPEVFRCYS